jgi:hypothetical protein
MTNSMQSFFQLRCGGGCCSVLSAFGMTTVKLCAGAADAESGLGITRWARGRRFERVGIIRLERAWPGNNAQN